MKKKKAHKKRKASKKANVASDASISKQRKADVNSAPEKESIQPAPLKKDVSKKADNNTFALKRYFMVARQFLSDSKVELKKVTWPTKKELLSTTVVVLVLVIIIAFFLGVVDLGLVKIIKNVVR